MSGDALKPETIMGVLALHNSQTQQVQHAVRAFEERGAPKSEHSEHELRVKPSVQEACQLIQEAMHKQLETTCPAFIGSSDATLLDGEFQPAQAAGTMDFAVPVSSLIRRLLVNFSCCLSRLFTTHICT